MAATCGSVEVERLLLSSPSKAKKTTQPELIACADKSGCSPLHIAAIYGNRSCAQALLAAGACLEARDDEEQTPLLSAASFGHVDVVQLLLAEGGEAAMKDKFGRTGAAAVCGSGDVGGGGWNDSAGCNHDAASFLRTASRSIQRRLFDSDSAGKISSGTQHFF